MTNPKRLYETERKRQQRARISAGQVHKLVVYLTEAEMMALDAFRCADQTDEEAIRGAVVFAESWL